MSRYRPPRPPSSPYITPAGYKRLQDELTYLWKEKRPEVTRKVAEAAAQGDRSENAEYIYGKRQLREIDARVQFLSRRLDVLEVVDRMPNDQTTVFFGAWVTLEDSHGKHIRYRIVGADEFDSHSEYISVDAPLARELLGKQVDAEIKLEEQQEKLPRVLELGKERQVHTFYIVDIEYADSAD